MVESHLRHVLLRWAALLGAMLVLGPAAAMLTSSLRAPDGGPDASLLLNSSAAWGAVVGVLVFLLAAAAGVPGGRIGGVGHGFFCAGLVLAWGAWGTGRIDHILHRTQTSSTMYVLSGEAVLVGVLALALGAALVMLSSDPVPDPAHPLPPGHKPHVEPRTLIDRYTPQALIAAAVVGGLVVWLLAQDTMKGQTFAAAAFAGMLGATAGRMASPGASVFAFLCAIVALAVISPVAATFMHGGTMGPTRAALAGTLFALARPLPLDWMAGAFVGIPLGLSWAGSMVERHAHKADGQAA